MRPTLCQIYLDFFAVLGSGSALGFLVEAGAHTKGLA